MRRTCRCIWAPWARASRPWCVRTPPRCSLVMSMCSTTPTTAAHICPTSPSSRRCIWTVERGPPSAAPGRPKQAQPPRGAAQFAKRQAWGPCSTWARAVTTPMWVASRLGPCRRSPRVSKKRVCRSITSNWSIVACCARPRSLPCCEIIALLQSGQYPSRNPQQNLADLKAQIAANEKGVQELRKMVEHFGLDVVQAYMGHVQDNAEEAVRRAIDLIGVRFQLTRSKDGNPTPLQFTLPLDNGAQIQVAVRVNTEERSAEIDFSGTSAQQLNNFNAPTAVCMAAVLYVFRTLVDDDIPLNAGCLKPLKVIIPAGSMLNPNPPASVVAGNVETSSCITNALYGALQVMAGSQCTMNNFTFGNERYQYYETISGGSGAGGVFDATGALVGGFDGTSVVQTHMTNSRLTDPEVLEFRFPVRLESYEIRSGSGGAGRWHGGDGGGGPSGG